MYKSECGFKLQVLRIRARVEHVSKSATAVLQHCFYFSFWSAFTVCAAAAWLLTHQWKGCWRGDIQTHWTVQKTLMLNLITPPLCTLQIVTPFCSGSTVPRKPVWKSLGHMIRLFAFTYTGPLGNVMVAVQAWKKLWSDIWWVMSQGETPFISRVACLLYLFLFYFIFCCGSMKSASS